jgi:hypothetical protein
MEEMKVEKRYAKLDDIGVVGSQERRSGVEIQKEARKTARFIKAYKAKAKSSGEK